MNTALTLANHGCVRMLLQIIIIFLSFTSYSTTTQACNYYTSNIASTITKTESIFFSKSQQSRLSLFPHDLSLLIDTTRKVYAHRHMFPISYDNKPPEMDRYMSEMTPNGLRSSFYGSFLRERPLPRPVRTESSWRVHDAEWDIRMAKEIGIDGFWFNLPIDDYRNPNFWPAFVEYLTAAEAVGDFTITPNIDLSKRPKISGAEAAINLISFLTVVNKIKSPALLRIDGKLVVSSFAANNATVDWWISLHDKLIELDQNPYIVITTLGWNSNYIMKYSPVADAYGDWGIRNLTDYNYDTNSGFDLIPTKKRGVAMIRGFDTRYKNGEGSYYESNGSQTLREHWESAIRAKSVDWAQLITWNDYGEDTSFSPNTAKQYAVYDISSYYISWFKTGKQPRIVCDSIYYFHRIMNTDTKLSSNYKKAKIRLTSPRPSNIIEVVSFLTEPGTIEIKTLDETYIRQVPKGISSISVPLPKSGTPEFRLLRGGSEIINLKSAFRITDAPIQDDLVYRAGGSLRANYGLNCELIEGERILTEPVWLAQ